MLNSVCLFAVWLAVSTTSLAAAFDAPAPEPRRSIKVERITPDMMAEICGFEQQDKPFFLDNEYRRAIADYSAQIAKLEPGSQEAQRLSGLRDLLNECRENDLNKRSAQRARRSCKDLVREHKKSSARVEAIIASGNIPRGEVMDWGERFWPPLQKCLDSMKCRLNNSQDMEDALAVYHEVVDEMSGWLLDVQGAESMKVCGATIRDLKKWCKTEVSSEGNTTTLKDVCVDPRTIADMINWVISIRPSAFSRTPVPGGTIGGQP